MKFTNAFNLLALLLVLLTSACAHPGDRREIMDEPDVIQHYEGAIQDRNLLRSAVYATVGCTKVPAFCKVQIESAK